MPSDLGIAVEKNLKNSGNGLANLRIAARPTLKVYPVCLVLLAGSMKERSLLPFPAPNNPLLPQPTQRK